MDIHTENIRMVSQMADVKIEQILKWRGRKSLGPLL